MQISPLRRIALAALGCAGFVSAALAQDIDVRAGAKAQADTSARVGSDGSVSVQSRSKAEAETSVSIGSAPGNSAPNPRNTTGAVSSEEEGRRARALQGRGTNGSLDNTRAPEPEIYLVEPYVSDPQAPPRPRPPLPCKKTVEAVSDDLRITIINNYCVVKVTIQKLWREGGKTHVQFEADNAKGGQQANLRMVEHWTDRSGRAVVDPIDEQKIAIAKGRNIVFSVSGPTPAAMTGTITLYR